MKDIIENGKILILACDQGFEHGPVDFNELNIDPQYIFDIALEGKYTAVAVQAGIAKKFYHGENTKVPLIVKLNGKTSWDSKDPVSLQHTSVEYASRLGASAVGYTIYLGSSKEQQMFVEFGKIVEEAHRFGMKAVCWMYSRGPPIKNDLDTKVLAYGARVAFELGADVIKLKYNNNIKQMNWVIKCAGGVPVVFAGGDKTDEAKFVEFAKKTIKSGGFGLAVGRNVWQSNNPIRLSKELRKVLFEDK